MVKLNNNCVSTVWQDIEFMDVGFFLITQSKHIQENHLISGGAYRVESRCIQ